MSILTAAAEDLQIWDDAAFDPSLGPTTTTVVNPLQPLNLDHSKENQIPLLPSASSTLDAEIAAIESEIAGLSKKLHSLRLRKAHVDKQSKLKEGKTVVPSNYLLNLETPPRNPQPLPAASKAGTAPRPHSRGLSLGGPTDLLLLLRNNNTPKPAASSKNQDPPLRRRGMSVGPSEIFRQTAAMMTKPMNSKISELRKGIATVGPKVNSVRKGDGSGSSILKPKTLFLGEIKKRPKGRVVASRYSLPNNNNNNGNSASKGGEQGSMKRRKWSPPSPPTIVKIGEGLPKIRIVRGVGMESPRDSGRAKKVAELVGKRSLFFDEGSLSSCSSVSSSFFVPEAEF